MSQPNQDKPSRKARPVNIRKALAGLNYLEGKRPKEALTEAGYSPKTARNASWAGLGAVECIDEARKLREGADPAKIVSRARTLLGARIERELAATEDHLPLDKVAKVADIAEKWYSGALDGASNSARASVDRVAFVRRLLEVAASRGLLDRERLLALAGGESPAPTSEMPQTVEAEVVASQEDTATGSDNTPLCKPGDDPSPSPPKSLTALDF